jgi:hypothetical protein
MKKISTRNWFRIVWFSFVAIFFIWQWSTYQSKGVNEALLISDQLTEVKNEKQKISFIHIEEVSQNADKLPGNAQLKLIRGGNHSQFGFLGTLLLDGTAQISREEQMGQTVEYLTEFLNDIKENRTR